VAEEDGHPDSALVGQENLVEEALMEAWYPC